MVDKVEAGASDTAKMVFGGSCVTLRISQLESLGSRLPIQGAVLDSEAVSLLLLAAEAYDAERKALSLIARAEQSSFLLGQKLEARGFSREARRLAMERLTSLGYIDDRRFAGAYAASRLARRAEGPRSLEAAIRAKGVDGDTARRAVESAMGRQDAADARAAALDRAVKREMRRKGGTPSRVKELLQELGFKSDEIREYFDSLDTD